MDFEIDFNFNKGVLFLKIYAHVVVMKTLKQLAEYLQRVKMNI